MSDRSHGLLPDDPESVGERIRRIVEFWNQLDVCGASGETTWGVLEKLRLQVTECLDRTPPDVGKAESLTAYAMHLIRGSGDH